MTVRRTAIEMLRTISMKRAQRPLDECVRELGGEPLVITANGRPDVALVPVDGVDLESLSTSTNLDFIDFIERSRRRHRGEGGRTWEEIEAEFAREESAS